MGNALARDPAAREGDDDDGAAVAQYFLSAYDVADATKIARRRVICVPQAVISHGLAR